MAASEEFRKELIRKIPDMTKFAMSLTRSAQESEDLMHDTVISAMEMADTYTPGTNMVAWLFTIQRGIFNNSIRRARASRAYQKENADKPEVAELPRQFDHLVFEEAKGAIDRLPVDQKAAFFLVAYDGKSYIEAAEMLGCSVGTVKSRVSRARAEIARGIGMSDEDDRRPARQPLRQMDM